MDYEIETFYEDPDGREITVIATFNYYAGMAQTYMEPAEEATLEVESAMIQPGEYISYGDRDGELYTWSSTLFVNHAYELNDDHGD